MKKPAHKKKGKKKQRRALAKRERKLSRQRDTSQYILETKEIIEKVASLYEVQPTTDPFTTLKGESSVAVTFHGFLPGRDYVHSISVFITKLKTYYPFCVASDSASKLTLLIHEDHFLENRISLENELNRYYCVTSMGVSSEARFKRIVNEGLANHKLREQILVLDDIERDLHGVDVCLMHPSSCGSINFDVKSKQHSKLKKFFYGYEKINKIVVNRFRTDNEIWSEVWSLLKPFCKQHGIAYA